MGEKTSSSTISSTEVRELLRTAAKKLSGREEKALRMRSGQGLGRGEVLARRGQENPETRAELLAMEIELQEKLAARPGAGKKTAAAAPSLRSKEKDKIIRALRRLK